MYLITRHIANRIKTLTLIIIAIFVITGYSFGQLSLQYPNISPKNAVQNVLLGAGITVSNVKYNGSSTMANSPQNPVRKFNNSSANFPLTSGVMLKTNQAPDISDPDLQAITTNNLTNGVILEFDFVPTGDTLSFSYIFTSAEYSMFTCSAYNDVFGFFISGPGINGPFSNNAENIATVPGTNVPVGINTVNSGNDPDYNGYCASADPHWQDNNVYFTTTYNSIYNGSGNDFSSFNGSTVEMTANASVICGETYHIKLAISNVMDHSFDSGVFLKAGSFASNPIVNINVNNVTAASMDSVLVEGCDQGQICFTRPITDTTDSLVIHYTTSGSATQGVDYNTISNGDSIVFLPGEDSICKPIIITDDNINEGMENAILSSYSINACGDTIYANGSFWISDHPVPPQPNAGNDTIVCNNGTGIMNGTISNATDDAVWSFTGPGTINVSPNIHNLNAHITTSTPGTYTLRLTESNDTCSLLAMDSVQVIFENLDLTVSNDTTICQNGTAQLQALATGGNNFDYHWDSGNSLLPNQSVNPSDTTTYNVFAVSENGCSTDTLPIIVNLLPPLDVTSSLPQTICPGDTVTLLASATGGIGAPYSFVWKDPNGNVVGNDSAVVVSPIDTTNYTVVVTDGCETTPVTSISQINNSPLPVIDIAVKEAKLCTPATFEISNLTDPSQVDSMIWYISDGQTFYKKDNINPKIVTAGQYNIQTIVVTPSGCRDTAQFDNFLEVYPKPHASFTYYPKPATVLNSTVHFQNSSYGGDIYAWNFEGEGLDKSSSSESDPKVKYPDDRTGNYKVTLTVTSEHQCVDSTYMIVEVKPDVTIYAPNAFTPDGDNYNQIWKPYLNGIDIYSFSILIYNRWGELIWESHNKDIGWDGTYGVGSHSGQVVKPGVYVWKIRAKDAITDKKYSWNGTVTILR